MEDSFEWDEKKNLLNIQKHHISFEEAQYAFSDKHRMILPDVIHSRNEKRYFCIAHIEKGVITVRFTYRKRRIRILGAGFWRAGRKKYLKKNGDNYENK